MQNSTSKNVPSSTIKKSRVWLWLFSGLAIVTTLVFIMLPVGIDYGIENYLKDQGADQISLVDVDFNPLTGRMKLTGLIIITETQTVLQIPEAIFKVQWTPFIRKRFVLERFVLSNTELIVEQREDGSWKIGGISLPAKEPSAEPASWQFAFQEATFRHCRIKLISPQLRSYLVIEQAKISKLTSWLYDSIARLELNGRLNEAPIQLGLDVSPFGNELAVAGKIKLEGLALDPFGRLLQPYLKMLKGRFDIDAQIETRRTPGGGLNHHQKGLFKLHRIRAQMAEMNLAKEGLSWDGAIRLDMLESEEALKIIADGRLDGSGLNLETKNNNLKVQQDKFTWNGKINAVQDKTNRKIAADGRLDLGNLKMEIPQLNLAEEKLTWQGPLQYSTRADDVDQRIIADGALEGSHLKVNLQDRRLNYEHQGLSWKGRLDSGQKNDFSLLTAAADFSLKEIEILHAETSQHLLKLNTVDLQTIRVETQDEIDVSGITLKGLSLLAEHEAEASNEVDPSPLRIQEVAVKDMRLSRQKDLAIDAINLKAVQSFLHRGREGKLPAIERWIAIQSDILPADQADQTTANSDAKDKTGEFKLRIGKIGISGDSELRFKDDSVDPTFDMGLKILEAQISNLDNSRPQQPASVKLLFSDGKDARLSMDGTLQPFAELLSLDCGGKIEALELPLFSPYVIQNLGHRFSSGEMQADIPIKIKQNQIEGKIDLVLFNPAVERVKEDRQQEEQGKIKLAVPLDSALKLMRDKQNNVRLNIPVSGDINDPKFSIADAVNKVLAKALQTSALSYLKFALGPYGIGISVAQLAYDQAMKIRLNPIQFVPGSTEIDAAAIDYLERVAAVLKEHPAAQLVVCGVATESDRSALGGSPLTEAGTQSNAPQEKNENDVKKPTLKGTVGPVVTEIALIELAKDRVGHIEDQLVKLHGIAANRIIACKPRIDKDAGAVPRADLEI